jgi:hypothetical protein
MQYPLSAPAGGGGASSCHCGVSVTDIANKEKPCGVTFEKPSPRHPGRSGWKMVGGRSWPSTAADRQEIDDHIDVYLLDADLPPPPKGYVWIIRVPDGHTSPDAFLVDVDTAIIPAAGSVTHPKQLRPISLPCSATSMPVAAI